MAKILDVNGRLRKVKIENKLKSPFEVRDRREKEYFVVDDAYLNGFARICGVYASMVYFALCRHSGRDQTCFPSVHLLSEKLKMGETSVKSALKILERHRIIAVARERGYPNIYTLTNKKHWLKYPKKITPFPKEIVDAMTYVHDEHFYDPDIYAPRNPR